MSRASADGESGQASQDTTPPASDTTKSSQDVSPARAPRSVSSIPQLTRSRKGSQEFSPTRNANLSGSYSTIPSAAAVQRALSAHRPIIPPPSVDGVLEAGRADRTARSGHNSPAWPTSPRLKSPPPSILGNRSTPARKNESEQGPSMPSVKRPNTISAPEIIANMQPSEPQKDQATSHSGIRVPIRGVSAPSGALETVAENSVPTTPSIVPAMAPSADYKVETQSLENRNESQSETSTIKDGEASGDGASKPTVDKPESSKVSGTATTGTAKQAAGLAKRSFTSLAPTKNKTTEPMRTMTVETEPVTAVPQLIVGERGTSGRDGSGSVRTKPSTETMRPKKEKKRTVRKAPPSGTVTSKADIFEAKVASAVDEADSSDSDETFVYESNPPEARTVRHHSRTPSATSLASQDQHGNRSKHGVRSGSQAIAGKKSMKFSNSAYNSHLDGEGGIEGRGSTRASSTPRHHHIGRHSRTVHSSIFDPDSPFTQASKTNSPRTSVNNLARTSRPNSPRLGNGRLSSGVKKNGETGFDPYEDVADDERTPLMNSVRITRTRHSRRPNSSGFRNPIFPEIEDRGFFGRHGGCMFLTFVITLIVLGVATFVIAITQPLQDVSIIHLQNILASEQEIMLDLHVEAINTNLFAITVSNLDVNLFAESPYVGSAGEWRSDHRNLRWGNRRKDENVENVPTRLHLPPFWPHGGVDEGTDPPDDPDLDPEPGTQKMLLGRISEFDSPLVFEASPIRRAHSSSVGEVRLSKPGNKTEEGGSARWERVLQHEFDLILRGVIKYSLPMSSKVRSAKVAGRATVFPSNDDGSKPPEFRFG